MGVRVSVQGLHHLDELIAGARAVRSRIAVQAGQSLFELEGELRDQAPVDTKAPKGESGRARASVQSVFGYERQSYDAGVFGEGSREVFPASVPEGGEFLFGASSVATRATVYSGNVLGIYYFILPSPTGGGALEAEGVKRPERTQPEQEPGFILRIAEKEGGELAGEIFSLINNQFGGN